MTAAIAKVLNDAADAAANRRALAIERAKERFDSDATRLLAMLTAYLNCYAAHEDTVASAREDVAAACMDFMTNEECREAADWAGKRGAGRIAA